LTRLTLEELVQRDGAEEVGLYLRTGRIRAEVRPPVDSRTDFTIRSPIATASVRGTDFEFDTRRLYVDKGRVLLEGARGQTVYVDAGQRSYVDESAFLSPVLSELTNTGITTGGYGPAITTLTAPEVNVSIETDWR
jgi:ferric-dicitrate binding protein FerR (iron transport regulator)